MDGEDFQVLGRVNNMGGITERNDLKQEANLAVSDEEQMFQMICDTSSSAFLYYNFETDMVRTLGNWNFFFNIEVKKEKDFSKIYDCMEEQYLFSLRELLFAERRGVANDSLTAAFGKI